LSCKPVRALPLETKMQLYKKAIQLRESMGWSAKRVAKEMGLCESTVQSWIYGHRPDNLFNTPDLSPSPELSYIIGVYWSDGSATKEGSHYRIKLSVKDRDFVEEFSRCISKVLNKPTSYPIRLQKDGRYIVAASSKLLFKFLRKGLEEHKLVIERYPADFLRGFFDGDGGVCKAKLDISATNSDQKLLEYIKYLLRYYFSIHSTNLTLITKRGTERLIRGHKAVCRKNTYQFHIKRRRDVLRFYEEVGFTIRRKKLDKG